jgi:lipopolysaccharide export system protein LptC
VRNLSSAIFPFTIATLLAGLTYALQWYVQAPDVLPAGAAPHKPDAIVSQAEIVKIGGNGNIKYRLTSPRILHFRDDDSTQMEKPLLQHFKSNGPTTTINSEMAHINGAATIVQFNGNVLIHRPAFQETPVIQGNMTSLTVYPDDGKAETASFVTLQRGQSWLKGTGMSLDNNRQLFVLHQNSRGHYPPALHP